MSSNPIHPSLSVPMDWTAGPRPLQSVAHVASQSLVRWYLASPQRVREREWPKRPSSGGGHLKTAGIRKTHTGNSLAAGWSSASSCDPRYYLRT